MPAKVHRWRCRSRCRGTGYRPRAAEAPSPTPSLGRTGGEGFSQLEPDSDSISFSLAVLHRVRKPTVRLSRSFFRRSGWRWKRRGGGGGGAREICAERRAQMHRSRDGGSRARGFSLSVQPAMRVTWYARATSTKPLPNQYHSCIKKNTGWCAWWVCTCECARERNGERAERDAREGKKSNGR